MGRFIIIIIVSTSGVLFLFCLVFLFLLLFFVVFVCLFVFVVRRAATECKLYDILRDSCSFVTNINNNIVGFYLLFCILLSISIYTSLFRRFVNKFVIILISVSFPSSFRWHIFSVKCLSLIDIHSVQV